MSVRRVKLSTGERTVVLVDPIHGLPDMWVAAYVVMVLRADGLSPDAVRNRLAGIARGVGFFQREGADLRTRALAWRFDDGELSAFADHCRRRRDQSPGPVKNAAQLYEAFTDYVVWLGRQPTAAASGDRRSREADLRAFLAVSAACRPRFDGGGGGRGERLGLTEGQRDLFLRSIVPTSPDNPFGSMSFRNYAMMSTAFLLGVRTGEILGVKVEDVDLARGRLAIQRRPDDPDDTRRIPASQKTLARELPMSLRLTEILEALIEDTRAARKRLGHPYVLVNQDGGPLGHGGLQKAYVRLRRLHPTLGPLVHHVLRHDWNDRWHEMVEENGWDLAACHDHQSLAMGWKVTTTMHRRYGKSAQWASASRRHLELQLRSEAQGPQEGS